MPIADCRLGRARTARCAVLPSPTGRLVAAFTDRGLCRLTFRRGLPRPARRVTVGDVPAAAQLAEELARYFRGDPEPFVTPLDLGGGTPFQQRVWAAVRRIPFGETASYAEVARWIGKSGAARAVGQAVGANPVAIVVPCHRVICSSGDLGGFGAGLPIKRWLLRHEQASRAK